MDKILLYGIPRSGNTLIAQVLRILFHDYMLITSHNWLSPRDLLLKHGIKDHNILPIIIPVRDFRYSLISSWRVNLSANNQIDEFEKRQMTLDEVRRFTRRLKKGINRNLKYEKRYRNQILWLRYEEFSKDFDYLFENLESFFNQDFSEDQKKLVLGECNIDKNIGRQKLQPNFSKYDAKYYIHGHHINTSKQKHWTEYVEPKHQNHVLRALSTGLKHWNYLD